MRVTYSINKVISNKNVPIINYNIHVKKKNMLALYWYYFMVIAGEIIKQSSFGAKIKYILTNDFRNIDR